MMRFHFYRRCSESFKRKSRVRICFLSWNRSLYDCVFLFFLSFFLLFCSFLCPVSSIKLHWSTASNWCATTISVLWNKCVVMTLNGSIFRVRIVALCVGDSCFFAVGFRSSMPILLDVFMLFVIQIIVSLVGLLSFVDFAFVSKRALMPRCRSLKSHCALIA